MKINPENINNVIDKIYSSLTHIILQDDMPLKLNNIIYSDVTYVCPDPDNLNTDCIIIGYRKKKDTITVIVSKFYENTLPVKNRAIYKKELNHDLTPLTSILNTHNFKRIKHIFDTMYSDYKFNTTLKDIKMGKLADEEESKLHWFTQIEYIDHKHGSKLCDYYQPYLYMTQDDFDSYWGNQKNKGHVLKSYIKDDNLLIRFMDNGQIIAQSIH